MDRVLQTFEGLIRRSIAPSVTFLVIFAAGELIAAEAQAGSSARARIASCLEQLGENAEHATGLFALAVALLVLGLSYGLSATQQILFDNRLKKNFDPGPKWIGRLRSSSVQSETRALAELRGQVLERLDDEPRLELFRPIGERTDFLLYEILGGIDPTDTRPFVDTAKSVGIVFSSAIAVTLWNLAVHWPDLGRWAFVLVILTVLFYWLGREATLAQYRTRALRLYVNFLMMPVERLERRLLRPKEMAVSGSKVKKDAE